MKRVMKLSKAKFGELKDEMKVKDDKINWLTEENKKILTDKFKDYNSNSQVTSFTSSSTTS